MAVPLLQLPRASMGALRPSAPKGRGELRDRPPPTCTSRVRVAAEVHLRQDVRHAADPEPDVAAGYAITWVCRLPGRPPWRAMPNPAACTGVPAAVAAAGHMSRVMA
ncbi:hypothetical protein FB570_1036 [Streptomyces sp. T12]|nr:hypothetical protein FB570_1036 [Streptomyces sp. T12]